jgi:hypothetical protein
MASKLLTASRRVQSVDSGQVKLWRHSLRKDTTFLSAVQLLWGEAFFSYFLLRKKKPLEKKLRIMRASSVHSQRALASKECPKLIRLALANYPLALQSDNSLKKQKSKCSLQQLRKLDEVRLALPNVAISNNGCIKKENVKDLMEWKLQRGKMRPQLRGLIASNSEATVEACTKKALGCLVHPDGAAHDTPDIQGAFKALEPVRGMGPATASALLSLFCPSKISFMADEVLEAATGRARTYTITAFHDMMDGLRKVQKKHNLEKVMSLEEMGRGLWAYAALESARLPAWEAAKAQANCATVTATTTATATPTDDTSDAAPCTKKRKR